MNNFIKFHINSFTQLIFLILLFKKRDVWSSMTFSLASSPRLSNKFYEQVNGRGTIVFFKCIKLLYLNVPLHYVLVLPFCLMDLKFMKKG